MACSAPSSVTVKSFAVSPATGWPLLSFTFTVSIANWLLVENVAGVSPPGGAFWPIFWASESKAVARTNKRAAVGRIVWLKPQYESCCQTSHGTGRQRKAELRAAEGSVPAGEGDVVERVGGINPQVAAQPVAQSERSSSGRVQRKLEGARNGVAPGVAEFTRQ